MYAIRSYYDLGGLIVIDFIDMMDQKHKTKVEAALKTHLKGDKARTKGADATAVKPTAEANAAYRANCVITSYSIHYTKLYDRGCDVGGHPAVRSLRDSWTGEGRFADFTVATRANTVRMLSELRNNFV